MADWIASWWPALGSGTWAEWVTACVAFLALGAAVWAGLSSHRLVVLEQERDEARRENEARAHQADRVTAWPTETWPTQILVRNGSHLPIYDVRLTLVSWSGEVRPLQPMPLLLPRDYYAAYPDDIVSDDGLGNAVVDQTHRWHIRLEFFDTADRRWLRDERGMLHQVGKRIARDEADRRIARHASRRSRWRRLLRRERVDTPR